MKHLWKIVIIFCFVFIGSWQLHGSFFSWAQAEIGQAKPVTNDGQKWRIGYVETDPYVNFAGNFHGVIVGLEKMGWLQGTEHMPFVTGQDDSKELWEWLNQNDVGPYLEFVADAHYSLIDEPNLHEHILHRLSVEQDLDLILLMGTSPGRLIATDDHDTPSLVLSASNAVLSGIIASEHDSGMDHVWAHTDAERYIRQIEVFHDIFEFEKLALIYEDSALGRVYAAVADMEKIAMERGFELVEFHVDEPVDLNDRERYERDMERAFQLASTAADAFYMTAGLLAVEKLEQFMEPFYQNGVPVFSQMGANEVRHGALMSLYRADFNGVGQFGAETMTQVLLGASPRELPQIYGDTPNIVLNLEVAERIGYRVPFDILLVADLIYTEIEGGNEQ